MRKAKLWKKLRILSKNWRRKLLYLESKSQTLFRSVYRKVTRTIDRHPLISVFSLLGLLLLVIIISNLLRTPAKTAEAPPPVKKVSVYHIGRAPVLNMTAQIDKSGVIQISALAGGVVQKIFAREGDTVSMGKWLVSLSSNYQGGNSLTLARKLSEKQNQIVEESFPIQKELISKQRELADRTKDNSDQMKDITAKSADSTQNLINLNDEIISTLDNNLISLESSTSANASLILSTKQLKSQFQSANLQLNSSLRNINYQIDSNNPPSHLASLAHDIAINQLNLQEKALDLNKEISLLQLQMSRVNEALMYPSSPVNGTVQKVFVRTGQPVAPGTPLFIISGSDSTHLTATVYTSRELAQTVSRLEPARISTGKGQITVYPSFISSEAIQGNLYSLVYNLPSDNYAEFTDKGYIPMEIPIGYADTSSTMPFVPLDSVYQTQNDAYLFITQNGRAESRKVELGEVIGRFVRITNGITGGDTVILDRNITQGDEVITE